MKSAIIILLTILFIQTNSKIIAQPTDSMMLQVTLIEKHVMESNGQKEKNKFLFKKSELYQQFGNYNNAIISLRRIADDSLEMNEKQQLYFEKALNLYLLGAHYEAYGEFRNLKHLDKPLTEEALILEIALLLENHQWGEFKRSYIQQAISKNLDTTKFSTEFILPEFRDPAYFKRISGRVPGLGLLKSGYISKGISSITLQLLCVGFAGYNLYQGFYFTGIFSGIMPARRFYNGGKYLAESVIEQENDKKIAQLIKLGYQYIDKL